MRLISRNIRNYFVALAVTVVLAGIYQAAETRLLHVPDVVVIAPRPPTDRVELKESLADLFPQDAWQLGDCKRLLTNNGVLLFQDWRQITEDQWKLWPITIVVGRGLSEDASAAPIVLTANEGAEVQFAHSFDMTGGSAPPIKMGRMIGDVTIERAGATKRSDQLLVKTRTVRIDNQKVWTTEAIDMQVAGADLKGRDLTIYLAASAATATKAELPSTILDRMDLVYLEELRIPLDDPTDGKQPRRIGTKNAASEYGEVSIGCNNGMGYDFALDRLSLRDSVTMVRSVRGQVVDRFDCDTLDLVLRNPADRSVQRRGPLDWINRVRATGQPAVLDLASYDFEIRAEEIDFDARGGLLSVEGETPITIRRGLVRASLDRLDYQYDPETPETIGVIDVHGRGTVAVEEPEIMLRELSWLNGFKVQPTDRATVTAVKEKREQSNLRFQIDGDVQARLSDGGVANAGSLEGILKPHYVDQPAKDPVIAFASGPASEPVERIERKMILVPEIIHATNAVSIDTNQVVAETNELSLFFERSADFGKKPATSSSSNSIAAAPGTVSQPTDRPGSLAAWVNQPASASELRTPIARPRPQLSGRSVSALLLITPAGVQPKDVSIEGDVRVEHQILSGESILPVEMTGQTMRLLRSDVAQSSGQDYLQLGSGPDAPARLQMGDGFFVGPIIKVWPSDNVVQVTGAGELKVPQQLLRRSAASQTGGDAETSPLGISSIEWTSAPYCRWGGDMQFDGQTALLTGGVQVDAEFINNTNPWNMTTNGDEMQIALAAPVKLMDRLSMSSAELREISLMQTDGGPVVVRAEQRAADQTIESRHMISASRLDMLPGQGGQLRGSGPGWYRGWMMMKQKSSLLSPDATAPHLGGRVLQGVHLTFQDSMQGDLEHETLAFTGGVRTGVRKLQSWDEIVDIAEMERLAVGEMTMDCRQLKFGITPGMPDDLRRIPGMPTPWEMVAEGGVVVRSNTEKQGLIEGTATRASYESAKSWLNIEGSPGRDAFIRRTWLDGRPGFQTNSPRMMLNLKTFEFQTIMQDAQINNLTLPGRR